MTTPANLRIDGARLWESLMEMGRIGATPKGGVCRLALGDADKQARDLFVRWAEAAGCAVSVDAVGNIFARRAGRESSRPPVLLGSHLDTQPSGGKFDGAYGVLAGLEVLRSLNDLGCETEAPIEVVAWTNEEGTRFAPAMLASGVFAGQVDLDYALSRTDLDGKTLGEELKRIGYAGTAPTGGRKLAAYFELHIEQGPILEAESKTIGIVTDCQGVAWYEIALDGQDAHAGATPMERRRDALLGASRLVDEINRIALAQRPHGRATVGRLVVQPNSCNVVPGRVFLTVDMRHPDEAVLRVMDAELRAGAGRIAAETHLDCELRQIWHVGSVRFDRACVAAVRQAVAELDYSHRDMVSGAGHDACHLSKAAPTAMIFIPCVDGLSHNESEHATPEWVAAGANVLLRAAVLKANETAAGP